MASFYIALLISLTIIHQSIALPADVDSAPKTDSSPQKTAPPPLPPQDCTVYVGDQERKMKPGCQICWVPPEHITCKDGDWSFGTCDPNTEKCQHTGECTTTCVPKPQTTPRPKITRATTGPSPPLNQESHGNMTRK